MNAKNLLAENHKNCKIKLRHELFKDIHIYITIFYHLLEPFIVLICGSWICENIKKYLESFIFITLFINSD